jgi:hypothetical protein
MLAGLIFGLGWLSWRQSGRLPLSPSSSPVDLSVPDGSATPGALLTVAIEELPNVELPAETPLPERTPPSGEPPALTVEAAPEEPASTAAPPGVTTPVTAPDLSNPSATEPAVTSAPVTASPGPLTTGPTPNPTEGVVGASPTPPGRLAPEVVVGPLRIWQIRIFSSAETGLFSGRANITNGGDAFLNQLVISWRILDTAGQVLDQGEISWPNLAPGETSTMALPGSAPFVADWDRIEFAYSP